MKGLIKRGLTMTLAALVGASTLIADTKSDLEKEIGKLDSWASTYIQRDYTKEDRTASMKLRMATSKDMNELDKFGSGSFALMYHKGDNVMVIPPKGDVSHLSHELAHAVCDDQGEKGLMFQEGYEGPTPAEIEVYCKKRLEGDEFRFLKLYQRFSSKLMEVCRMQHKIQRAADAFMKSKDIFAKHIELLPSIEPKRAGIVKVLYKETKENLYSVLSRVKELPNYLSNVIIATTSYEKNFDENGLANLMTEFDKYVQLAQDADKNEKDAMRLRSQIYEMFTEAGKRKGKDIQLDFAAINDNLADMLGQNMEGIKLNGQTHSIDEILQNYNEVFARIVDSAYAVHFRGYNSTNFTVKPEDIEFLKRFHFKGELVYKKAIEKCEVGLNLLADGKSPSEVQKILQYATKFEYKGVSYSWPAADSRIKGKIPQWDLDKALGRK